MRGIFLYFQVFFMFMHDTETLFTYPQLARAKFSIQIRHESQNSPLVSLTLNFKNIFANMLQTGGEE